jgi:hypothetical protein
MLAADGQQPYRTRPTHAQLRRPRFPLSS